MDVSLGNSRVAGSITLEKKKNLQKLRANRHRRENPHKRAISRQLGMPPNGMRAIRELNTRTGKQLNRQAFKKVDSLRESDITKMVGITTSKREIKKESLRPGDRTDARKARESPRRPKEEELGKHLRRTSPRSPLSTSTKRLPLKRKTLRGMTMMNVQGQKTLRREGTQDTMRTRSNGLASLLFRRIILPFQLKPKGKKPTGPLLEGAPRRTNFNRQQGRAKKAMPATGGPRGSISNESRSLSPHMRKILTVKEEVHRVGLFKSTVRAFRAEPLIHPKQPIRSAMSMSEESLKKKKRRVVLPPAMQRRSGTNVNVGRTLPFRHICLAV